MPNESKPKHDGLSTLCVHGGEQMDARGGMHTPLYNHSTFGFASSQELLDVVEGRSEGNLYSRYGSNPTLRATERKLALLEGAEEALAFNAGMAAISAVFLAHCKAGGHVVCVGDIYGGTFELLAEKLPDLGIHTTFLLGHELDQLANAVRDNTRIVYCESVTNPNMNVTDIAAVAQAVKRAGLITVVDNTFASPINTPPLALGADLVLHSATKYLGGHSDLTGGVVMGSKALLAPVRDWRKSLGQFMAPDIAFVLARSLRTLSVRVRQQNETALKVAEFLENHPKIKKVNYPGLASAPDHATAVRQMAGYGGMISFVFDGDGTQTAHAVDRLQLIRIAVSLGGVESLVTQPVASSHHGMSREERQRRGIGDGLVRLSIGLEDAEDLIADLEQALA